MVTQTDKESLLPSLSRFVSTLTGAYRAFLLYTRDNKALDEIMNNLLKRFQDTGTHAFKLEVTNRSLLYNDHPVGTKDLTEQFATDLNLLGYREIIFRPPLQTRNFHQLLHTLTSKDSNDVKFEKLENLFGEDETRPICLIAITANATALRLPDEVVRKRLAPLMNPRNQGGPGFVEELSEANISNLPDLYTWICLKASFLDGPLQRFVKNLTDATREGYFPVERFVRLFPMPENVRTKFSSVQPQWFENRGQRSPQPMGHGFKKSSKGKTRGPASWIDAFSCVSGEEANRHQELRKANAHSSVMIDLDLAEALLAESGPNFLLGLTFLNRILGDNPQVAPRERAFRIGMTVWAKTQGMSDKPSEASLLSALRQHLTSPGNLSLAIYPLRTAPMESDIFNDISHQLQSLGEAVTPALIQSLEAEQDRGMRRKLCHLITCLARQKGPRFILDSIQTSSPFLLRNILMILGDLRDPNTVPILKAQLNHPQKMVQTEALRSLAKIGNDDAQKTIKALFLHTNDRDHQRIAMDFLSQRRDETIVDLIIQMSHDIKGDSGWRKAVYEALGRIGGPKVREHFESTLQLNSSIFSRFQSDQKEECELIKSLLARMAA